MSYNLGNLPKEEMDKVNEDLQLTPYIGLVPANKMQEGMVYADSVELKLLMHGDLEELRNQMVAGK